MRNIKLPSRVSTPRPTNPIRVGRLAAFWPSAATSTKSTRPRFIIPLIRDDHNPAFSALDPLKTRLQIPSATPVNNSSFYLRRVPNLCLQQFESTMSTTEIPSTLPGNVSLEEHDPIMFDLIEKEKVRKALRRTLFYRGIRRMREIVRLYLVDYVKFWTCEKDSKASTWI